MRIAQVLGKLPEGLNRVDFRRQAYEDNGRRKRKRDEWEVKDGPIRPQAIFENAGFFCLYIQHFAALLP